VRRVCVFCGSRPGARPSYARAAEATARAVAGRGLGLVYGGASVGLMGVMADAALAAGAEVVGVVPRPLVERELAHDGLSELHVVETMHERKALMADLSDGFLALPGGAGTLEELFEVWTWAQLGLHGKPCGLLDVDGYYRGLAAFLDHAVAQRFLTTEHRRTLLLEREPARCSRSSSGSSLPGPASGSTASDAEPLSPPDGADALHLGRTGLSDDRVLVGDDPQVPADGFEQLTGPEQERGARRRAEPLVAAREGLVDQDAARGNGADQLREERSVQVVHDHDSAEGTPRAWKGTSVLQVALDRLQPGVTEEIAQPGEVPVDGNDTVAALQEQARVTPAPARHVQHVTALGDLGQMARHPSRGGAHDRTRRRL
jgi:uncharacterized protein (TIGR00730 family)